MYNSFKLIDGLVLGTFTGNDFTTPWVDVRNYSLFSVSIVVTGDIAPSIIALQQSNDRQFTGGGGPLSVNNIQGIDILQNQQAENSSGPLKIIQDAVNVGTGNGVSTITTAGAGVYILDQFRCSFGWFRVIGNAQAQPRNGQLDIFVTLKQHK